MSVADKVMLHIVSQFDLKQEDVKKESEFIEDLGLDSIDTVLLTISLEEEFNIEIPDQDAQDIKNVGQLISYIEGKVIK